MPGAACHSEISRKPYSQRLLCVGQTQFFCIAFTLVSGYGLPRMSDKSVSDTLKLGDMAPGFTLNPANRPEPCDLKNLLMRGPVIVEFLRGTW